MAGSLIVAATPIGNPADASPRLIRALADARIVAAEDTRRVRRLADALGVTLSGRIVSMFEGNEARRTDELLHELVAGQDVLLVSDAGTPVISDPGHRLVSRCADEGIRVTAIPGASAVAVAVAVSGLAGGPFCFEGFLPRRAEPRRRRLTELVADPRPTVFFESPRRAGETLADLARVWGDRPAVVCRELTKTHEEIRRGTLVALAPWAAAGLLGEVTIVVAGAPPAGAGDPAQWLARVDDLMAEGMSRRDAAAAVAAETGASRRDVYQASLPGPARESS